MSEYKVAELAQEDLMAIYEHIASENPDAAVRLMQTLRKKFALLAQFPNMGRERNDLLLYLRVFPVGKYLVFYQHAEDYIEILRIRHSAMELDDLFDI